MRRSSRAKTDRALTVAPRPHDTSVTTATTLEKGIRALETASPAAPFDVALVEEKQAEPLFLAAAPAAASKDPPAGAPAATEASAAMGARFAKLTSECAIVLMHEEEDVGNKAYMIEAIRLGVVDVVRFPLVKQSMRTLWQHAVRRMIRVVARETRRAERHASEDVARVANGGATTDNGGSGGRRGGAGAGGAEHPGGSADSGDSTASEEGRVKRGGGSSPDSVLAEEAKKEAGAGAGATGKRKAGATGSSGSGNTAAGNTAGGKKEDAGKKIGAPAASAAGKPKPQPRSTQQWRAAEQRGRRLAIKPHTAVVGGVGGAQSLSGTPMRHGGVYYHPGALGQPGMGGAHAGVLGQTQTMTINGQQVQVWVPMSAPGVGGGAGPGPGPGGVPMYGPQQATRGGASGASGSPPRGEEGDPTGSAGVNGARGGAQPFYGAARGMNGQMYHGHAHSGMLLVQQANGQQVWVPAGAHHAAPGAWNQHGDAGSPGNLGGASMGDRRATDGRGAVAHMRGELSSDSGGAPLGLGLKRSDSLQQMVESSGLLDADHVKARYDGSKLEGGATMDADMFRDAEMLEEDALDAILAHARDGGLLSFDGMDEAMLEAAAGPETGVSRA